jgi:hypothetical protein
VLFLDGSNVTCNVTCNNNYAAMTRRSGRTKLLLVRPNKTAIKTALQWNTPMRFKLLKFIQIKNARPTIFASGTKPQ